MQSHFITFSELRHLESMNDLMICLSLKSDKSHHSGNGKLKGKTAFSRANEFHNWRLEIGNWTLEIPVIGFFIRTKDHLKHPSCSTKYYYW